MKHTMTTTPTEIGLLGSEGVRDLLKRSTSGQAVAAYAEAEPPLSWRTLAEGGWDVIGVQDEEEVRLRDLVEIARAWGRGCVQQPLVPTIMAKRHSRAAAEHEGPVTVALPLVGTGVGHVPHGRRGDVVVAAGLGAGTDELLPVPDGDADDFAITVRGVETDLRTAMSDTVAREMAVILAAEVTGGAERLLEDSVAFAGEREQFGRPVGSFQAVKHHLADAAIAAELAETAVIWGAERPEEAFRGARFAVQRSIDVAEIAVQVHGGLGFTWEMGLHFFLRNMMLVRDVVVALEEEHGSDRVPEPAAL